LRPVYFTAIADYPSLSRYDISPQTGTRRSLRLFNAARACASDLPHPLSPLRLPVPLSPTAPTALMRHTVTSGPVPPT